MNKSSKMTKRRSIFELKRISILFVCILLLIPAVSPVSHATEVNQINSQDSDEEDSGWQGTKNGIIACRVEYDTKFYSHAIWYVVLYAEKVDKTSRKGYTVNFILHDNEKSRTVSKSLTIPRNGYRAAMILYPQDLTERGDWNPDEFGWEARYTIQLE